MSGAGEQVDEKYKGFGGWLILFAIFPALLFPLLAAAQVISMFVSMGRYFDPFPGLLAVFMIDLIFKVALLIWGFYVVFALVRLAPYAGESAKKYLVGGLVYALVAVVFPFIAAVGTMYTAAWTIWNLALVFPSIGFVVPWYFYFKTSQRVTATYGRFESGGSGWLT
jgi:hypothetical protein